MARKIVYGAVYADYDEHRVIGMYNSYVEAAIAGGMLNPDGTAKLKLPPHVSVEIFALYDTAADEAADKESLPDSSALYVKHIYDPMIAAQNERKAERDAARREDIKAGR